MRLKVYHRTTYNYSGPVSESYNEVRLKPMSDMDQTCLDFRLLVKPSTPIFMYLVPGGAVHHFAIRPFHSQLEIIAQSLIETRNANPFIFLNLVEDDWSYYEQEDIQQRYTEFLSATRYVPLIPETDKLALEARRESGVSTASFLLSLMRIIYNSMAYRQGATNIDTPLTEIIEKKHGVCQDFSHLMLSVCRSLGIPSRYVSGYVRSPERTTMRADMATHAWIECLLPDGQWRGFDPTNNLLSNDLYVKIHVGRDYGDVTPTKGIFKSALISTDLDVDVTVDEVPRGQYVK